jgi:hypothetical protein
MARSLFHRLLVGNARRPSGGVESAPVVRDAPQVELTKGDRADDSKFKGADWDPYEDQRYFSGDKPVMGHPGANWMSFRSLREAADRSICAPFKSKRQQQFIEHCRPAPNRWAIGCELGMRDPEAKVTDGAKKEFRKIWTMLNRLQPFHRTMGMLADDSLTYDWAIAEIQYERGGRPSAFRALDAAWVRRGRPKKQKGPGEYNYVADSFVQVLPSLDRVVATWHADEIMCVVRRPRTTMEVFGYGYPEIQQAYDALVAYIEADDYNQVYFRNGAHASTLLQVIANYDKPTWLAFKSMMTAQIKGINNAHRIAMALLSPGTSEATRERIEKLDLAHTNNDIQFVDLMLIKLMIVAANWNMRPVEVGLPEYRGTGTPLSGANPKDEIQLSRKFGLEPMLTAFEDALNQSLIYRWHEEFAFRFISDSETEGARLDLEQKGVQAGIFAANESRTRLGQEVIDRGYFERRNLECDDATRDRIILAASVPLSSSILQALGTFMPAPKEGGEPGGPEGAPEGEDAGGMGPGGDEGKGEDEAGEPGFDLGGEAA